MFSKEEIEEKLWQLSKTTHPTELAFGARCYAPIRFPSDTIEYVCPICGEKTIYKPQKDSWQEFAEILVLGIARCRKEIENVKGINIRLDESQFCKHCSPRIKNPELCLFINIEGEKNTIKVCNINYLDIRIIHEFLSDSLIHKDFNGSESPLILDIERIKELFGIK